VVNCQSHLWVMDRQEMPVSRIQALPAAKDPFTRGFPPSYFLSGLV
jgi:hypothetical protein